MKTIKLIILELITFLLFLEGSIINVIGDSAAGVAVTDPSTLKLVALAFLAVYEVVVRIVPSVGDYSVVSWIIRLLKKVSDTLNVTK